ncbi:CsbD family protein [Hoyosella subflava]|uniref:CsbD-like domain-containing protein n=1 Tax=Hoyosella subflava (strain DSM 45089 / JCM 17490 / NBRC 109087 / DQS3-9A1) TaxID=443218 RepID=F6ELY6_HOYSD|nr:CsbD family protein [Hoyosella subflava]AEF42767.1 hypothetical protein AS9A_4334 [Hoyosella subflava DQS3-9A1]
MADFTDRMKHKAEELSGEAKQKVGKHTDDSDLQGEGASEKASAKAKQAKDKVTDAFKDAKDALKGDKR